MTMRRNAVGRRHGHDAADDLVSVAIRNHVGVTHVADGQLGRPQPLADIGYNMGTYVAQHQPHT